MKLDLHGYTVHTAWQKFRKYTQSAYLDGRRKVVVVTGYGKMQSEFIGWCDGDPYVESVSRLDPNAGAFNVIIKKRKHSAPVEYEPSSNMNVLLHKLQNKYKQEIKMRKPYGELETMVMNDITDWSSTCGQQFDSLEDMIRAYWAERLPE